MRFLAVFMLKQPLVLLNIIKPSEAASENDHLRAYCDLVVYFTKNEGVPVRMKSFLRTGTPSYI